MTRAVLTLPENTQGRDFVVGDIHGVFDLLDEALKSVDFDPEKDRLIAVGDLINRGPQSEKCLEYLKQPWFHAIRGNHEEMFLRNYKNDGNTDLIASFANASNGIGWIVGKDKAFLDEMRSAFEKLPIVIEIETRNGTIGFVHADVPPEMDWQTFKQKLEEGDVSARKIALTGRKRIFSSNDSGVAGVSRVYLGHTPVESGAKQLGNCFYMDTGGVFRVLKGDACSKFFLTLSEISAPKEDIGGMPEDRKQLFKVITKPKTPGIDRALGKKPQAPEAEKPFGRYNQPKRKP